MDMPRYRFGLETMRQLSLQMIEVPEIRVHSAVKALTISETPTPSSLLSCCQSGPSLSYLSLDGWALS